MRRRSFLKKMFIGAGALVCGNTIVKRLRVLIGNKAHAALPREEALSEFREVLEAGYPRKDAMGKKILGGIIK